jgi:dTDP-4-dehydrorhamnose 3,5-epimerase
MLFHETGFPDLLICEPKVFEDNRGYFFESYNQRNFIEAGLNYHWVQDNQSQSSYGVVRGLHFQHPPYAQTKLVRVLSGSILDVVVDIRKGSPSFGKVFSIEISSENKLQLLVPKGFAHGFSVLSPKAEVLYKCDSLFNKASEGSIMWNDPDLAIDWKIPTSEAIVSEKDNLHPQLKDAIINFNYGE